MEASPTLDESHLPPSTEPSSTAFGLVKTICGREEPALPANGWETCENALKSLEEATKEGDVHTACNVLQFFRKQYAQKSHKKWPMEVVRCLWTRTVYTLEQNSLPEIGARACQLIEVLGQNCKSCNEEKWERLFDKDAPKHVIKAMEQHPLDLSIQSSALRAMLSMSGCMTCRSFYDKETQDLMGKANAIPALTRSLAILHQLTTKTHFDTNAHKLARLAIADAVQALHYICLMNKDNITCLASLKGFHIITMSIEDNLNELTVQEHGCMVLAELVTSTSISSQYIMECVLTVTNVVRLQMQEKSYCYMQLSNFVKPNDGFRCIEVARAGVWSLASIARNRLHPSKRGSLDGLETLWRMMQGQGLSMIMGMMQSCQLKNDPLVKHCLDFIAVVCDDIDCPSLDAKTLESFKKAKDSVYNLFIEADDIRIKAVAIRTLCIITHHLHNTWPQNEEIALSVEALLYAMRTARERREAKDKDAFCTQVFGLILISRATTSTVISTTNRIIQYIQDVHEAIGYVINYIEAGGEEFLFDSSDDNEATVEISCCKNACHCCFIHEKCKTGDILGAVAAVFTILSSFGGDGINSVDRKGRTVLHKLASFGNRSCLKVFIDACGDELDFSVLTPEGLTAQMLAFASCDPSSAPLLEISTTVDTIQDKILKEQSLDGETTTSNKQRIRRKVAPPASPSNPESGDEDDTWPDHTAIANRTGEDEYERVLAERRKQLEDMDVSVRKSVPCDRRLHFDEKPKGLSSSNLGEKAGSRFFGSEGESLAVSLSTGGEKSSSSMLGTSVSAGSVTNNGSPDLTAVQGGSYDDRIVDSSLSAFQARDHRAAMNQGQGDDKITNAWHSLFSATVENGDNASMGGMSNKWSMLSSSSGQNNQPLAEGDRQGNLVQQSFWTTQSNPTRPSGQPVPSTSMYDVTDRLSSIVPPTGASKGTGEDDGVDDKQILSWLSSEITGLISNGSPPNKSTPEMNAKARELRTADFAVPPPPPLNPPSCFDHLDESGPPFPTVEQTTASPFYSGNPIAAASPYIQQPSVNNFVHSHSSPWGQAVPAPSTVMMDPRLVPQSELNNRDGRPTTAAHSGRFWHTEENDIPSKHLWLGNLNTRLPRSVLKSVFEEYGPIEDVVTFPGRMYAFVNFINAEDAQRAAKELDNMTLQILTGNRKLVIKFRPNRKALGRVGDLMPGVANIEERGNTAAMAPSISVPIFRSPDLSSPQQPVAENVPIHSPYMDAVQNERQISGRSDDVSDVSDAAVMAASPCRHLWLGNVCVRPSKTVLFSLFSRYGPVESVRVFPGKTYAFVNFHGGEHAFRAKEALDGKVLAAITGTKPLVVRFQREGSGPVGWPRAHDNFNNLPPLQSAESAPGGYSANPLLLSPGRSGMQRGEHRPVVSDAHRTPSISPDDYPSLSRPAKVCADGSLYDVYQQDRHQRLPTPEEEVVWTEAMAKEMGGVVFSSGYPVDPYAPNVHPNAAAEASSIGQLTRTLSAATISKAQRPSPYARAPAIDRNTVWNPTSSNGAALEEPGLPSSFSATLNPSHSFGGYDAKAYSSPFFHPQLNATKGVLGASQSWLNPVTDIQRVPENGSVMSMAMVDPKAALQTSISCQTGVDSRHDFHNELTSLPQTIHPYHVNTNGGTMLNSSSLDLDQPRSSCPAPIPSAAAIMCEKGTIW